MCLAHLLLTKISMIALSCTDHLIPLKYCSLHDYLHSYLHSTLLGLSKEYWSILYCLKSYNYLIFYGENYSCQTDGEEDWTQACFHTLVLATLDDGLLCLFQVFLSTDQEHHYFLQKRPILSFLQSLALIWTRILCFYQGLLVTQLLTLRMRIGLVKTQSVLGCL